MANDNEQIEEHQLGVFEAVIELYETAKDITTTQRIKVKELMALMRKQDAESRALAVKTYQEICAVNAKVQRVADAWDREHKQGLDLARLLRNTAAYFVGKFDERSK